MEEEDDGSGGGGDGNDGGFRLSVGAWSGGGGWGSGGGYGGAGPWGYLDGGYGVRTPDPWLQPTPPKEAEATFKAKANSSVVVFNEAATIQLVVTTPTGATVTGSRLLDPLNSIILLNDNFDEGLTDPQTGDPIPDNSNDVALPSDPDLAKLEITLHTSTPGQGTFTLSVPGAVKIFDTTGQPIPTTDLTVDLASPTGALSGLASGSVTIYFEGESHSAEAVFTASLGGAGANGAPREAHIILLPLEIVPDWNRDGKIDEADRGKVTAQNPFRWWINDDDDSGEIGKAKKVGVLETQPIDVPGIGKPNHQDHVINGLRDLVDFFPLHLGLEQALKTFPQDQYMYLVKHADGAVKFHEVTETVLDEDPILNGPGAYLRNLTKAKSLESSSVKWATSSGVNLSGEILDAFADRKGIIICEATKETDKPLVVEIRKNDGTFIAEIEFPVIFSAVEKMYRHGNMRSQVGAGSGGLATQLNDPGASYPDNLTNEKYFVFLHGFNVPADAARGWHAEIFKRLHQLGSQARFIGISWHGDTSPDYHKAVKHAFVTSEQLASWLQVPGEITIAAHSLGNMVVSNAIEHHGLNVKRYFMINAATPIEAYDGNQKDGFDGTQMDLRMTENDWKPYDRKLYSGNWHELFASDSSDGRNKLTWKNRFASKVPSVAYNFYSTGEDVVENADATESFAGNIWDHGFVRHAWVQQEIAKGNASAAALALKDTHAGWDFHFRYIVLRNTFPETPVGYFKWGPNSAGQTVTYRYEAAEAALLTPEQLKTKPFHWPFKYTDIYDPAKGSAEAAKQRVQQDLLAAAIPAMSYAAVANSLDILDEEDDSDDRNFNMMNLKNGNWPAERNGDWYHSDFRDVAISYTWPMYQEMIKQGELDEK